MKFNTALGGLLLILYSSVFAATPVFTLIPLSSPMMTVSKTGTATVQYTVTNQSPKQHTLLMTPIKGITQDTTTGSCPSPFTLTYQESCILTLQITGSRLEGNIYGGPVVCQQAPNGNPNPLLCYQPNPVNQLNITLSNDVSNTLYVGASDGYVYYSNTNGETWGATTSLGSGVSVLSVYATTHALYAVTTNNIQYSTNYGVNWSFLPNIPSGTPNQIFAISDATSTVDLIYVTSSDGIIYYFSNGDWEATTSPASSSLTGIFVIPGNQLATNQIYVGSTNGTLYYSANNGSSWTAYTSSPDGSSIYNVFATNTQLFVNTVQEYVYTNNTLTGGAGPWAVYGQTAYSLYVNGDGSVIDAGTQGGYVFSLSEGSQLGFVTYAFINSVFLFE